MRFRCALLVLIAAGVTAGSASAAPRPLLHQGSHGQAVKDLQWLLGGHAPSRFKIVTFPHEPTGLFGARTAAAVVEMKRRLGFPTRVLKPYAGNDLREILLGQRKRPLAYVSRATRRLAADGGITADDPSSKCAIKAIGIARGELGVHEIPDGSNYSPRIGQYEAVTGAFRAPWCASFVQWVLRSARIGFPKTAWSSTIAANSAGVFYIARWASDHGWLRAIPKAAYLAAFTDHLGHIGIIERVTRSGFWSIEGNASNRVLERFHPFGARPTVFIRIPGCAAVA